MLRLPDDWIWDLWTADDGDLYHLFFLKAPRALGDPDLRHLNVTIGHAVSADLRSWNVLADVLSPSRAPAFDDRATWTGSTFKGPDGRWWLFYTGVGSAENGLKQRVGVATSPDLLTWTRLTTEAVCESDPRWYEQWPEVEWYDEAWRDPWVFADPEGGWHMLLTARARTGPGEDRGVIGYARSHDLLHWEPQPPLTDPGCGFGHLEVPQVEVIDGKPVLMFCCLGTELAGGRPGDGGIWVAEGESVIGPFDIAGARRVTDETLYAGRLVRDRTGRWVLLAFRNVDSAGAFVGEIIDPIPFTMPSGSVSDSAAVSTPMRSGGQP